MKTYVLHVKDGRSEAVNSRRFKYDGSGDYSFQTGNDVMHLAQELGISYLPGVDEFHLEEKKFSGNYPVIEE